MNTAEPTPIAPSETSSPLARLQASNARARSMPAGYDPSRPAFDNPVHPDNSMPYQLGASLRQLFQTGPGRALRAGATLPFNHGPWLGAGAGGIGGGALGYGLARLWNQLSDEPEEDRPLWGTALGALAGTAGGALLGALRAKSAALLGPMSGDRDYVRWRVLSDGSLSVGEKNALAQALAQLSGGEISELADKLRTLLGAGAGLLVARFLLGAGVGGMLLGALTGGFVGARMGGPSILGRETYSAKTDAYGNPYTF